MEPPECMTILHSLAEEGKEKCISQSVVKPAITDMFPAHATKKYGGRKCYLEICLHKFVS